MSFDGFRVIEILDEFSLIINYGENDGAEEGQRIRIISVGPEVIDPFSYEILGTLDSIKAILTIETVYDNFSICKKIESKTTNILMSPLSQFQTTTREVLPLNIDKAEISLKKAPSDKVIKVGDIVEI